MRVWPVDVNLAAIGEKAWRQTPAWRPVSPARSFLVHAKARHHLLGDADHHDALLALEASEAFAGDLLLALVHFEVNEGNPVALGEVLDAGDESLGHFLELRGRDHGVLAVLVQKPPKILRPAGAAARTPLR